MWIFLGILGAFVAGCVLTYLYQSKVIAAGKEALSKIEEEEHKIANTIRRIG